MYGQYLLIYIQQYRPQIKHHSGKHAALQTNTYHLVSRLNPLKTKRPSASRTPRVCPLHVDLAEWLCHLADALIAQWNPEDEPGQARSANPAGSKKPGFGGVKKSRKKKNLLVLMHFGCKYWIQASVVIRKPQMDFEETLLRRASFSLKADHMASWLSHSNLFFSNPFPKIPKNQRKCNVFKNPRNCGLLRHDECNRYLQRAGDILLIDCPDTLQVDWFLPPAHESIWDVSSARENMKKWTDLDLGFEGSCLKKGLCRLSRTATTWPIRLRFSSNTSSKLSLPAADPSTMMRNWLFTKKHIKKKTSWMGVLRQKPWGISKILVFNKTVWIRNQRLFNDQNDLKTLPSVYNQF